jgi:DNA-binding response OmpR family regulator
MLPALSSANQQVQTPMNAIARHRVLLVDDDEAMLSSMAAILSDTFEVRTCASPLFALRLIDREKYHVVCADWLMPELDGMEFFRSLSRRNLKYMPCCILITAHTAELLEQVSPEDRRVLGIIRKPFRPQELIERVAQYATIAHLKHSTHELRAAVRGGHS